MKNTAIVIGVILLVWAGWLIVGKSHTPASNSVVESDTATTEQVSDQVVAPSIKKTSDTPVSPTVSNQKPQTAPITTTPTTPITPVDTTKYYTSAEVAAHASMKSCWSIVNGKVYDLTSWISQHPGGSGAIKGMCGVDGSDDFDEQHGGQSRPERELAAFYIGVAK